MQGLTFTTTAGKTQARVPVKVWAYVLYDKVKKMDTGKCLICQLIPQMLAELTSPLSALTVNLEKEGLPM